jgi:membrane protein implicated in regulation of membrane protease activity
MTPPGDRDHESLEVPAYLGRSRYEGPVKVSYGSAAWVGVVALLGLVGAVVGLTTKDAAATWIGLGVFLIFAVGYALLIRKLVKEERDEQLRSSGRR